MGGGVVRAEYRFATATLRASGHTSMLRAAIGGLCASMAVLGWLVQFHPLGPHGLTFRALHLLVSTSSALVGLRWLFGPWPSLLLALAFVTWADVSVAIAAGVLSAPASRLCATIHLGLIGVFAGFFLGARVLAVHCGFATILILGLAGYSVITDHVRWFDLYIYVAPALSSVVVLPLVIQVVIEQGRRVAQATARDALRDPATGAYNRRGMYSAATGLALRRSPVVVGAAVIDLDGFKDLNDAHGHEHGDVVLKTVTDTLKRCTRSTDVVARVGGDEFVVIGAFDAVEGIDSFLTRIQTAMQAAADTVTASVGIAWQPGTGVTVASLDAVLRQADTAMYQAKRHGGNRIHHAEPH
jgi:diguanylate cyclase (GGDEF)-like protein